MTWIVTWVLLSWVPDACPVYKSDEYGRWPSSMCLVNHGHFAAYEMSKRFSDKKDADEFYEKTIKEAEESKWNLMNRIKDVKLFMEEGLK
jgi:hypothetical protein